MNVGLIRFTCTGCTYQQILRQLPHRRVFADGSSARIPTVIAWCHDQSRIVESEEVAPVALLESLLGEVEQLVAAGTPLEEMEGCPTPEELRREIAWRRTRGSPARCLECGSIRITQEEPPRPGDVPFLKHPVSGGQLVVTGLDFESYVGPEVLIDAEGLAIP